MLPAAQVWVSLQSPLGSCSSWSLCQEAQSRLIRPQLIMGWISYQFPTTCWVYLFGARRICLLQFGTALKLHLAAEMENKEAVWVGAGGISKQHKLMNICQLSSEPVRPLDSKVTLVKGFGPKNQIMTHKVGPWYHDITSGELHFHLLWVEKAPSETSTG